MIKTIIINQFKEYPKMQLVDVFKLIYQSTFGPNHIIGEKDEIICSLKEEYSSQKVRQNKIERLNKQYSRVYLGIIDSGLSIETFSKIFILSCKKNKKTIVDLEKKLEELLVLSKKGLIPFNEGIVKEQINNWKKQGYPALRHSKQYKSEYNPSYRVINNDYVNILDTLIKIDKTQDYSMINCDVVLNKIYNLKKS